MLNKQNATHSLANALGDEHGSWCHRDIIIIIRDHFDCKTIGSCSLIKAIIEMNSTNFVSRIRQSIDRPRKCKSNFEMAYHLKSKYSCHSMLFSCKLSMWTLCQSVSLFHFFSLSLCVFLAFIGAFISFYSFLMWNKPHFTAVASISKTMNMTVCCMQRAEMQFQ